MDEWPELSQELADMMDDLNIAQDDPLPARAPGEIHYDDIALDTRRLRGPLP